MGVIRFARYAFVGAGVFVFMTLCASAARAATEYCGAEVRPFALASKTWDDPSDVYAFSLRAKSARSVSGTAMVHASDGWYAFDFRDVNVRQRANRYRTPDLEFTRTEFASDYVYVRFPSPVKLLSAYVARASVTQDQIAHWDGEMHDCYAYDASQTPARRLPASSYKVELVDKQPEPQLEPGVVPLQARSASAPGPIDCAQPFADATVTKPVAPPWPTGYSVNATVTELVRVTVGPAGELDDAIVYVPTGSRVFDEAGVNAARASTYKAARAFCRDVPGDYLFRVEYNPD